MIFTGTDPENSKKDYLNAGTAKLILSKVPEQINTPLHENWINRHTALIQTTLDGAAQKRFSILPIDIQSDWKIMDSERNKQHQRVLCNKIRGARNETIKSNNSQLGFETIV